MRDEAAFKIEEQTREGEKGRHWGAVEMSVEIRRRQFIDRVQCGG